MKKTWPLVALGSSVAYVYSAAEELYQIVLQGVETEQPDRTGKGHQQIHVAGLGRLIAGDRAK